MHHRHPRRLVRTRNAVLILHLFLIDRTEASLFRPALVKESAVTPPERVGAADVQRRVVDKVEVTDGRRRRGDVREGFVEVLCGTWRRKAESAEGMRHSDTWRRGGFTRFRLAGKVAGAVIARDDPLKVLRHAEKLQYSRGVLQAGEEHPSTLRSGSKPKKRPRVSTYEDIGIGEGPHVTLFPVDVREQSLQFGVDRQDRLERQARVAVLVVVERVDLVMPDQSPNREAVLLVVAA